MPPDQVWLVVYATTTEPAEVDVASETTSARAICHEDGGPPWLKFDNAHGVDMGNQGYRRKRVDYDHWHRTEKDKGRPYEFTTVAQLLDDFWLQVKRVLDEKGIPNTL